MLEFLVDLSVVELFLYICPVLVVVGVGGLGFDGLLEYIPLFFQSRVRAV